jgi:ATP-dependent Lon protease
VIRTLRQNIENKRSFLEVTGDVVEHVDPIFYGDPRLRGLSSAETG